MLNSQVDERPTHRHLLRVRRRHHQPAQPATEPAAARTGAGSAPIATSAAIAPSTPTRQGALAAATLTALASAALSLAPPTLTLATALTAASFAFTPARGLATPIATATLPTPTATTCTLSALPGSAAPPTPAPPGRRLRHHRHRLRHSPRVDRDIRRRRLPRRPADGLALSHRH